MTDEAIPRPECPSDRNKFDADFGRQLIEYLGGDPSPIEDDWCWTEFAAEYGKDDALIERAFEYFRTAQEGDPAYAIYFLARDCGLDMERAFETIRKIKVGDPAYAIFCLARDCGLDVARACEALRKIEVGHPADAVCLLALDPALDAINASAEFPAIKGGVLGTAVYYALTEGLASPEWAREAIEHGARCGTLEPPYFLAEMVAQHYATIEWAQKIIETCAENNTGRISQIAYDFFIRNRSDVKPEWAQGIIKACVKSQSGNPAFEAYAMAESGDAAPEWARGVIEDCINLEFPISENDVDRLTEAMCLMLQKGHATAEWWCKNIEKCAEARLGNPSAAAVTALAEGHVDLKWVKEIIATCVKRGVGSPADAAWNLLFCQHVTAEWTRQIVEACVENRVSLDICLTISEMVQCHYADPCWGRDLIERHVADGGALSPQVSTLVHDISTWEWLENLNNSVSNTRSQLPARNMLFYIPVLSRTIWGRPPERFSGFSKGPGTEPPGVKPGVVVPRLASF